MKTLSRRARARLIGPIAGALALAAGSSLAEQPEATPLTLDRAAELALTRQPLLDAQQAAVRAARERAVSARQLPDPLLTAGVTNLPVNTEDRFSLSRDFMTMTGIGLMQEFPRAEKRRLRGERERLMASAGEAELDALRRRVRRDASLAYLDLYLPERAVELVDAMAAEAERERTAAEIAFRAGRAPQADVLAAEVDLELLRDRAARQRQDAAEAQERLARWIGDAAGAPTVAAVPVVAMPPPLQHLLSGIERHPELSASDRGIESAQAGLELARQASRPDWRVEAMYSYRPDFSEMATVQFGIDLPLFTGNRQDREVAAARETLDGTESSREDLRRRLTSDAAAAHRAWTQARERIERYDSVIVPRSRSRAEAALAAYRAGQTELAAVLNARRTALEVVLMRLELQVDTLRRQLELRYLNTLESES